MKKKIAAFVLAFLLVIPTATAVFAAGSKSTDTENIVADTIYNGEFLNVYRLFESTSVAGVDITYTRRQTDASDNYAAKLTLASRDASGNAIGGSDVAYAYNMSSDRSTANVLTLAGNHWYVVSSSGSAVSGLGDAENTVLFSSSTTDKYSAGYDITAYPLDIPMTANYSLVTVAQKNVATDTSAGHGAVRRKVEVYYNDIKIDNISCGGQDTVLFPERGDGMKPDDIVVTLTSRGQQYQYTGVYVDEINGVYKVAFGYISDAGNSGNTHSDENDPLAAIKADAKSSVSAAVGSNPTADVKHVADDYCAKIDAATREIDIYSLLSEALEKIDRIVNETPLLASRKTDAEMSLTTRFGMLDGFSSSTIDAYMAAIDSAESSEEIDAILEDADAAISEFIRERELDATKDEAKDYVMSLARGKSADLQDHARFLCAEIDAADDEDEIAVIIAGAAGSFVDDESVESPTQYTEEELGKLRASAKKKISDKLGEDNDFDDELSSYIESLYDMIDESTSIEEIEELTQEILEELDLVFEDEIYSARREAITKLRDAVKESDSDEKKTVFALAEKIVKETDDPEEIKSLTEEVLEDWDKWNIENNLGPDAKEAVDSIDRALEDKLTDKDRRILEEARQKIIEAESPDEVEKIFVEAVESIDYVIPELTLEEEKEEAEKYLTRAAGKEPYAEVAEALESAIECIRNAESRDEVKKARDEGLDEIRKLTDAGILDEAKTALEAELSSMLGDDPAENLKAVLDDILKEIRKADDIDKLTTIRENAIETLGGLLSVADITEIVSQVKESLTSISEEYDSAEVRAIVDNAFTTLDSATTSDEIDSIYVSTLSQISEVLTSTESKEYSLLGGDSITWSGTDGGDVTFATTIPAGKLVQVEIGDKVLVARFVTVTSSDSGSYVTVKKSCFIPLTDGRHKIKFVAIDGVAEGIVTVVDNVPAPIWQRPVFWIIIGAVILAGAGVAVFFIIQRKRDVDGVL